MRKHVSFVVPYPIGQAPSQRFRFEQYLSVLEGKGFTYRVHSFWSLDTWEILYKEGHLTQKLIALMFGFMKRLFQLFFIIPHADYVFIHREATPLGPPFFEWTAVNLFSKKIIYDFDDAIWLPNTSKENNLAAFLKWNTKVGSICKWSFKVSCGNSYLLNYALQFNKNVILNPTTIDVTNVHNPSLYHRQKKSTSVIIGWTGTHSTLPYLNSLVPVLKKIEEKFSGQVRTLIIANKNPQLTLAFTDFKPWAKQTEIEDLLQIDIGIMPLTDDIWAQGKCGFKALQYMALGIPTLASPVGVNTQIINDTIDGYLCESTEAWISNLEKLICDKALRMKIGQHGRKKVIDGYSVESNSSNFLTLFS